MRKNSLDNCELHARYEMKRLQKKIKGLNQVFNTNTVVPTTRLQHLVRVYTDLIKFCKESRSCKSFAIQWEEMLNLTKRQINKLELQAASTNQNEVIYKAIYTGE